MQTIKSILSIVLIIMLLASALPFFSPEDKRRDNRVDLEDAILWVKDFSQTAEQSSMFKQSVERVILTFSIVSGLTMMIKSDQDTKAGSLSSFFDFPFLISSYQYSVHADKFSFFNEKNEYFKSNIVKPKLPPPRMYQL